MAPPKDNHVRGARRAETLGSPALTGKEWRHVAETFGLSDRETEVARLQFEGLGRKQIAAQLDVRPATVKTHIEHLRWKMQVRDLAGFMRRVFDLMLLHREGGSPPPH